MTGGGRPLPAASGGPGFMVGRPGGIRGYADLSEGEAFLGLPPLSYWPEEDIDVPPQFTEDGLVLACFHPPGCACGRRFGIGYDPWAIENARADPNVVLLHEMVHAWQYYIDPEGCQAAQTQEIARHGYWDAPHEVEARGLSEAMNELGVRVWVAL